MIRPLALVASSIALVLLAACATKPADAEAIAAMRLTNFSMGEGAHVMCSGQPTPEQFPKLAAAGVRRVICLRKATESGTGWEERQAPHDSIEFVRFVIEPPQDLTEQKARELAALIDGDTPTLVACGSSNRVGAMMALMAKFVDGKSRDEALAIGKASGLKSLEPAVIEALSK